MILPATGAYSALLSEAIVIVITHFVLPLQPTQVVVATSTGSDGFSPSFGGTGSPFSVTVLVAAGALPAVFRSQPSLPSASSSWSRHFLASRLGSTGYTDS